MVDISIIIPSYNRHQRLAELLDRLVLQDDDSPSFEVLVVDDGSSPPLAIDAGQYRYPLRLIRQANSGPAEARNSGASLARGRCLVFIDDDCLPLPSWLVGLAKAARAAPAAVIGGDTVNGLPGNPYAEASRLLQHFLVTNYSPMEHLGGFFPAQNLLVPREVFRSVNGFDPLFPEGEDREFCFRCHLHGCAFCYAPEAMVEHHHSLTFRSFLRLHFIYGRGTGRFRQKARSKAGVTVPFSSLPFYFRLVIHPLQDSVSLANSRNAMLLFLSQLANLAGVIAQSLSRS